MPAVDRALVAVFTEGYASVLPVLFDVMGVAWCWRVADTTGKLFNQGKVSPLLGRKLVVHASPLARIAFENPFLALMALAKA